MWLWLTFGRLMQDAPTDFQNSLGYRGRSWLASLWKEILATPGYKERRCLKNHKIRKYLGCILRFDSPHTLFHGILSCRTNLVNFMVLWKLYKISMLLIPVNLLWAKILLSFLNGTQILEYIKYFFQIGLIPNHETSKNFMYMIS